MAGLRKAATATDIEHDGRHDDQRRHCGWQVAGGRLRPPKIYCSELSVDLRKA